VVTIGYCSEVLLSTLLTGLVSVWWLV